MRGWQHSFRAAAFIISALTISALLSSTALAALPNASDSTPAKPIPTHPAAVSKTVSPAKTLPVRHAMDTSPVQKKAPPSKQTPSKQTLPKGAKAQYVRRPTLQCVPFARAASGIELKGNAANWWDAASGNYARGQAPEVGSVLNFRATRGMRLGHVAVVTRIVSTREIEIDHANWAGPGASKGGVSRGMSVIDVSPDNTWSQVRVSLGDNGNYGSVYPTYGFIYDRPDNGVFVLNNANQTRFDEVAEAPSYTMH
jgi:surface antigen